MMSSSNFIVYKSSAGSGKTFTLVKEYLKLALAQPHNLQKAYKAILAITFTNKAASEMKWRIIKALKEISSGENDFLSNLIAGELKIDNQDLKERASVVLTDILHNYSDFSIGTIDSFTHRIIRTFALDLKLPINFQIETDSDAVFRKVIALLINNLGKDELITNYLVQYTKQQVEENHNWDPEQTLIDFIKEINKEGVAELIEQLAQFDIKHFEQIKTQVFSVIKNYEKVLKENGEKALVLINHKQLKHTPFYQGDKGIYNFYVKLANNTEMAYDKLFNSYVLASLNEDKWYSAKITSVEESAIDSIKHELKQIAETVHEFVVANESRYNVFKLISKNIYAMGLINELAKLTNEYKTEENVLFISEFNERISSVVNDEPTPFIFERLGDRYQHFLLDEFQDTSAMQWQNMLPLIDNSLGNGNMNLIVGDGKQSIYRWRNADVEQFVNLPLVRNKNNNELLQEREAALIRNFKEEVLNKNFRSESTVVKFNNELFEYLSEKVLSDDLKRIYDKQQQEYKNSDGGYVSLNFPDLLEADADETNTNYILRYIQQAVNDGYDYSDICVIVRANKSGNTVANFLIEKGVPVVSADSLLLNNAEEINVILSFLKYISNQRDYVSASVVLTYVYSKGYCDEAQYVVYLRELNQQKSKNLLAIIHECGLHLDVLKLSTANLFDCCIEIIKVLKINTANAQYVRFFLDEILLFSQTHTSNISLFMDWWERRRDKASVIIPEGINAVNIMTIHASKGLEFPVVISPYLEWKIEKTQPIWVGLQDEDIELPVALISTEKKADATVYQAVVEKERQQVALDTLNVLYVDFTRAVDRLHIISPKPKQKLEKNCHTWLYEFAKQKAAFDADKQLLEFGKLLPKSGIHAKKMQLQQLPIETLSFENNEEVIHIKEASLFNSNEEVVKAREYGILAHYILSQIKYATDVEQVIQKAFLSGDLNETEAQKIQKDITELLKIDSIKTYFENTVEVKNEVEILTASGELLRPDRVVINNNTATVIDYKTGKKQASKYHAQMKAYEQALLSLGYTSVKKILLYIHEREVEVL